MLIDFAPAFQHSIGTFDEGYNNTKISPQTDICRQIVTITIGQKISHTKMYISSLENIGLFWTSKYYRLRFFLEKIHHRWCRLVSKLYISNNSVLRSKLCLCYNVMLS